MNDAEFLNWLADRLVNEYGESEHVNFVLRTREIADKVESEDKERPDLEWDLNND